MNGKTAKLMRTFIDSRHNVPRDQRNEFKSQWGEMTQVQKAAFRWEVEDSRSSDEDTYSGN